MTVLSAQSIETRINGYRVSRADMGALMIHRVAEDPKLVMEIEPFEIDKVIFDGMSYGLTAAGYDIRIGAIRGGFPEWRLDPGEFLLCSSMERFKIPHDIQAIVHDKSTWARRGLALQNTVLEPGWEGYITLELSNHGEYALDLRIGCPIAQVVFHQLDMPTNRPYTGKYQNQEARPVYAKLEQSDDIQAR